MKECMIAALVEREEKEMPAFKGGKGIFRVKTALAEDGTKQMLGRLTKGCSIGMHTHQGDFEVLYILAGEGTLHLPGKEDRILPPGSCHYCPEGCGHSLENCGEEDLCFFAVVAKTGA